MDTVIAFCSERGTGRAPAAPFVHERGNFEAVREVFVTTKSTWTDNRNAEVRQPMTYLGRVKSHLVDGPTELDGVKRKFLSSDGKMILVDSLRDELIEEWDDRTSDISESWSWKDNQVALLVNMLRYALLKKIDEATEEGLIGEIPDIVEGPYRFCTSVMWDEGYPEGGKMTWPGGDDAGSYPSFEMLSDLAPSADLPAINLRGLNDDQAGFVMMMCGKWSRQSRYRLDFDLPRLAQTVLYRTDCDREIRLSVGREKEALPPMLSSKQAFAALGAYVSKNWLFAQMSVARGLVLRTFCQYLPVAIDGAAWLMTEWVITLPVFRAIRGRFMFLVKGDYSLASKRGLCETMFFGGQLETLNFAGIATCQALYYGLSLRSFRRSTEHKPENTEVVFADPDNLTSAAMAEVISAPIPDTGMPGIDIKPDVSMNCRNSRIVLWLKRSDSDMNMNTTDLDSDSSPATTVLSLVERERALELLDDIRGGLTSNEEPGELRDAGLNKAQQMYVCQHVLRYTLRIFENVCISTGDTSASLFAGGDEEMVKKIKAVRTSITNLADLFAAVLGDHGSDRAEPEGNAAEADQTGEWESEKPVLTAEETTGGVALARVILKSWPIPGVPTYIRRATGPSDFRLFDEHYEMRIKDLNRDRYSVRGDMGQIWKFALLMNLIGWKAELDMFGSEDSRKNFAYTPDGNVPIPPCQSPAGRGQSVAVTKLERGKDGAMIVDPRVGWEDDVIRIDVRSSSTTGEKIFAGLQASGDKKKVTTVESGMYHSMRNMHLV